MKLQTVMKNTAWMGLVQVANMALPLVTVPLVSRAFGPALYGLVASLTAISGYAGLLVIFGFHLSGPRAVARLGNDPSRISAAFSSIYFGQVILATLSAVAILSALPLLGFRNQQWVLGAIILFGVIASSLTPPSLMAFVASVSADELIAVDAKRELLVTNEATTRRASGE